MPYVGGDVAIYFGEEAQRITRTAVRDMVEAAGVTLKAVAEAKTPTNTGRLKAAWVRDMTADIGGGYRTEVHNDVDYAVYVENGTGLFGPKHAKYLITPKKPGGTLRFEWHGRLVFFSHVWHPGSKGHYMIASALNTVDSAVRTGVLFRTPLELWIRKMEAQADRQV